MKRYYSDDPEPEDFFPEENQFDGDEDEEAMQQMIIEEQGVDIVGTQLNIMATAIHFLAQSFFWKFMPWHKKVQMIEATYTRLNNLLQG